MTSSTTTISSSTNDLRVAAFEALPTPRDLRTEQPLTPAQDETVRRNRRDVQAVMAGDDDRLLVVVGPCSIHDPKAGLEYADRLAGLKSQLEDELVIVMRTYFEKPRTTVGWKGLINDPHLDGSHDLATGLRLARQVLREVTDRGLACSTEFLEPISPQYVADLISWGAIGARTSESQIHRQLASGLSMPIGFKNGTDGSLQVAIDGCRAAAAAQTFLGIDDDGRASLVSTTGNPDAHLVLRGGATSPNYGPGPVAAAARALTDHGLPPRLMIDASHANSGKNHLRQAEVAKEIADQIALGGSAVGGVMLESFLVGGRQELDVARGAEGLTYGQSVTDACMSWEMTETVLTTLRDAVVSRRRTAVDQRPSAVD